MRLQPQARISLARILLATDFSPAAQRALPYAGALARTFGAAVHLLHVVPTEPWETAPELTLREHIGATRKLEWTVKSPYLAGIGKQVELRHGGVTAEILRSAVDHDIDLVILGSRKRQRLAAHARAFHGREAGLSGSLPGTHDRTRSTGARESRRVLSNDYVCEGRGNR